MEHAKLLSLGGELVSAKEADYSDYYSLLICPNCSEPVFLRKGFTRKNSEVSATFVHHKAIPEVSICESRVGGYTKEKVEALATEARNQRIRSLNISIWKYLKSNLAVNLSNWSSDLKFSRSIPMLRELNKFALDVLEQNDTTIFTSTIENRAKLIFTKDPLVGIQPGHEKGIDDFIKGKDRLQSLHTKVSIEALEVFLSVPMKEIRVRLLSVLCHPEALESYPGLLDEDMSTESWKLQFISYLSLQIAFVFLTVDWLKVLQKR